MTTGADGRWVLKKMHLRDERTPLAKSESKRKSRTYPYIIRLARIISAPRRVNFFFTFRKIYFKPAPANVRGRLVIKIIGNCQYYAFSLLYILKGGRAGGPLRLRTRFCDFLAIFLLPSPPLPLLNETHSV